MSRGAEGYGIGRLEVGASGRRTQCKFCGEQLHDHEKQRVAPDDGPAGSFHYEYTCPDTVVA